MPHQFAEFYSSLDAEPAKRGKQFEGGFNSEAQHTLVNGLSLGFGESGQAYERTPPRAY
jgi:hypothetical protein